MTNDLMLAILALDSYNRGYDAQLNMPSDGQLGDATWLNLQPSGNPQSISFYATAYDWNGQIVISYRGTNVTTIGSFLGDVWNGYGVGGGSPFGAQAAAAISFFQQVAMVEDPSLKPGGADAGDWDSADIELTGHSLGGGLAGLVGAIYGEHATLFDNMTFNSAVSGAFKAAIPSSGVEPPFPGWAQPVGWG